MKRTLPLLLAALLGMTLGLVPLSAHANSDSSDTKVYTQPGDHFINGRYWKTECENYSSTVVRCTTSIWGTKAVPSGGSYVNHNSWVFNTLTYLPSPRADWKSNPLGNDGSWTASDGSKWRTECDTAATGRNGCRSYRETTVVEAVSSGGHTTFKANTKWVVNNLVQFSTSGTPAVTAIPASAAPLANVPEEQAVPKPAKQTSGKKVVDAALSKVGSSYRHAQAGPNAFDCSGLTSYAWKQAGVTLPRSSRSQFSVGKHISKNDLQPGDLVFYYSPISHVGIYVGDGKIVHAANPRTGVATTSLNSMPYSGAVRIG